VNYADAPIRSQPRFTALERTQDFLPSLPSRFLLVGGKRCDRQLALCTCFRRYAARARASALFFSSAAFFSAARRLIASIVLVRRSLGVGGSSLCRIAIVSTPSFLLHQWGLSFSPLLVNISCWQLETWQRALQDCRRDRASQGRWTCSWRESSGCGRWR